MITVIGVDGGPLGAEAVASLAGAACVAGAQRHLDAVEVPAGTRRIAIRALDAALEQIMSDPGPVAVLASGDPGFFGIVRALRARGAEPRVLPGVSSVALAFARLGLPWDDAVVVSAHGRAEQGRGPRRALAAALAHPKAAILTAPGGAGPEAFLPALLAAGRRVHVAQRLGTADEQVTLVGEGEASRRTWAHPNVVVAVDPENAVAATMAWTSGHPGAPDGWALGEDAFEHRASMITKPEVRALVLARLGPRPGTVVWDVGAGSGSVAVECARFGAHAIAFERDRADRERIRRNAAAHGVRVEVVAGTAPASTEAAMSPDAVFVGGGGPAVLAGVVRRRPARVVVALAAVDRVRPAHDLLAEAGYVVSGAQVQASRLAPLPGGSLRFAAANPVTVLWATGAETTGEQGGAVSRGLAGA
ncbi:precorrin-6y C5,15-methyltransferase (decarboxylating) subunit CbiE [Marinactinospora thermotolerans]|uniref:precorrin-6y C5,15-methyltransferase (decarboxylating) subunit CbiE n=1 Tax=Marinactinospora thermotolerans TaxID=531310 RepID=UPI003D941F97